MAKVRQRKWRVPGQRTLRSAWGFVTITKGQHRKSCAGSFCTGCLQERRFKAEWTQEDAQTALAEYLLRIEPSVPVAGLTLEQAVERFLATRTNRGNARSTEDHRLAAHLVAVFGGSTPLAPITAGKISEYRDRRLGAASERTDRPLTAAAVNRPLALLRGLLTKAVDEWEVLTSVPKIKLAREPQGRIRWLEPEEESRLLDACASSSNPALLAILRVGLETGLRRGELLGLAWDRFDMTRGVLRLEITKSGKRREVPMRQAVYDTLAGLPGAHKGRVWPASSIRKAWRRQ
jgi:integrase